MVAWDPGLRLVVDALGRLAEPGDAVTVGEVLAVVDAPEGSSMNEIREFRGLLIQNYRDRVLKGRYEAYAAADFALCYVCHAEAPFLSSTYADTNFLDHDKHVLNLANKGTNTSTDIDTPGAGQGNAICSECHFRTHGTALAWKTGDQSNERLVNFAPNVTDWNGVVSFKPKGLTTDGSCTLTCHGKAHDAEAQREFIAALRGNLHSVRYVSDTASGAA